MGSSLGVEWGRAASPMRGEIRSGDIHIVHPVIGGTLIAVGDGLGHGDAAADASARCKAVLTSGDSGRVISLMNACHEALIGTRGAALSIAVLDVHARVLTWLGVGNVRGVLVRADTSASPPREEFLSRGGIVGHNLPPLHASIVTVEPSDTLLMATDGVRLGFLSSVASELGPAAFASELLKQHGRTNDDALVLAARLLVPQDAENLPRV
jgi:negative regulator of sigma-B (phosphoserine phosphatase)